jgi:FtsP/CotA-like multicopper oxidase with cupredoxin domain
MRLVAVAVITATLAAVVGLAANGGGDPIDILGSLIGIVAVVGVAAAFTMRRARRRVDQAGAHDAPYVARRDLIVAGSIAAIGAIVPSAVERLVSPVMAGRSPVAPAPGMGHEAGVAHDSAAHQAMTVGEVDHVRNGFDPSMVLNDWDFGTVSKLPSGQTLREYLIIAEDKTIEVAPGVFFDAWTYNGRVPGPTIRATEGDRIHVEFVNGGSHPHTIHFHGIHSSRMDGVPGQGAGNIAPGKSTIYEFDAFPFGCHLYHCHTSPLKRHIHKGLYGGFIIDPNPARHPEAVELARARTFEGARSAGIKELVIVMNGFDTNFDGENELYAANTVAFHYANHPIKVGTEDRVRLYLINLTEFDPLNSLHLHANFFNYFDHGTTLEPTLRTIDTVSQIQAQRGILEFAYRGYEPGLYMFHAHQTEFVELGWMSMFEVVEGRTT